MKLLQVKVAFRHWLTDRPPSSPAIPASNAGQVSSLVEHALAVILAIFAATCSPRRENPR